MASPFKQLKVLMAPNNNRIIYWQYEKGIRLPYDATLSVEYSRAGGTWQILADHLPPCNCYIDARITNHNKYNNDFYRVRIIGDGQEYISNPQQAAMNLCYPYFAQANNLIRLTLLEADRDGRKGFLLKKKAFGKKCHLCKQFQDDAPVNEHCPCCLGTGIQGGYWKAIPLNIIESGQSNMQSLQPQGMTQASILQARCAAWPLIELGDVWVDQNTNQRYYIEQAMVASKYKHVPLVYNLKMHLLQLSDVMHTRKAEEVLQAALVSDDKWTKALEVL